VNRDYSEFFKSALQVLAILCLIALYSMVAHKAFADWTASIRMAGKTTFILAGWTGMNVAV
jgi:hypothetical protein